MRAPRLGLKLYLPCSTSGEGFRAKSSPFVHDAAACWEVADRKSAVEKRSALLGLDISL